MPLVLMAYLRRAALVGFIIALQEPGDVDFFQYNMRRDGWV
jgi:hypothetical protein